MSLSAAWSCPLWLAIAGFILISVGLKLEHHTWSLIASVSGIVCCLAALVIRFRYWRCPHCGKRLPRKRFSSDKFTCCPYCGQQLS